LSKLLSLVIPIYSNAGTLPELFERVAKVENKLANLNVDLQIILVNDASLDTSMDLILKFKESRQGTIIIDLSRNYGGIAASKAGWEFVTGEAFITLAADLQEPPELILDLVSEWILGSELVICERETRDDNQLDKLLSKIFYRIVRKYIVPSYPLGGFDLALLSSKYIKYLQESSKSTYPAFLIWSLGLNPKIIKYRREARKHGKSGWTFLKKLNAAINIIFTYSTKPLRISIFGGVIISLTSFAYGLTIITISLIKTMPVPGFATTISLLTFLSGTIIIILGIIGEYLLRISLELDKKPTYVVKKIYQ
jgi:glycosyltransferase involved in cell wall biosynthesis